MKGEEFLYFSVFPEPISLPFAGLFLYYQPFRRMHLCVSVSVDLDSSNADACLSGSQVNSSPNPLFFYLFST